MSYDPSAFRQGLARLGMDPVTGTPNELSSEGKMRVIDSLMVEKEAILGAYFGGASVAAIYRLCKEHSLVTCSVPCFYGEFNHFLGLAQVPKRARLAMKDAKRRLALKPGVAKLLSEIQPILKSVALAEAAKSGPSDGPSGRRARRVRVPATAAGEFVQRNPASTPVQTSGVSGSVSQPRKVLSVSALGPVEQHRENIRRNG